MRERNGLGTSPDQGKGAAPFDEEMQKSGNHSPKDTKCANMYVLTGDTRDDGIQGGQVEDCERVNWRWQGGTDDDDQRHTPRTKANPIGA